MAHTFGGRTTPRSGAGKFEKADAVAPGLRVECKTTKHLQYTLKHSTLELLERQAKGTEQGVLVVQFEGPARQYAVLPLEAFEELWRRAHAEHH